GMNREHRCLCLFQVLLSRLIDVLKDSGLEPAPGSSLTEPPLEHSTCTST
ncbi:hypothetical protein HaLaN_28653, partial [Haematococcus lacustris]